MKTTPAIIPSADRENAPSAALEGRVAACGRGLSKSIGAVLAELPCGVEGPQQLATALGLDKVFTSRLLKAARSKDPIALAYHLPGAEPLRRFLKATARRGVSAARVRAAGTAVDALHDLVRREIGDRSAFEAVVSSWLPEARAEFESRRKQAAYRALSQLKGVSAETTLATVLMHPNEDGRTVDIAWLFGLLGLRRLRAGATAKLTTRRIVDEASKRRPLTLAGEPVDGLEGLRLDRFCHAPPTALELRRAGDTVHYLLGGAGFGRRTVADLVLGELNLAEMPRHVPAEKPRRSYAFAEVSVPSRTLLFDVLVDEELYGGSAPELLLYDTALEGVADVNDPSREVDRLDMNESIRSMGRGLEDLRARDIPNYVELVAFALERLGWDPARLRGYRCRIEYPLYGSQVTAAFECPTHPRDAR